MNEKITILNRRLETFLLLLTSHHPELHDKDTFLQETEIMGVNGEELYKRSNRVCRRYFDAFEKGRAKSKDEVFFFSSSEFAYLIMAIMMMIQEYPERWRDASDEELKRLCLTYLSDVEYNAPSQIDTDVILGEIESLGVKFGVSDETKWKLSQFLLNPQKYIDILNELIEKNLPNQKQAEEKLAVPLNKLMQNFIKQDFSKIGDMIGKGLHVKVVNPVFATPYLDYFIEDEEGDVRRYVGLYISDMYKMMNNTKKADDYLLPVLKALGDKSKFEIIMSLKTSPKYNLEIAEQLGLTPATMSHHMGVLLSCNLVQVEKSEGRVYYSIDKERINNFVRELEHVLMK